MAPKMEPGGLFMTSSSALARQEAARRPNRQQKRDQDRPKSAKSRFQANLGGGPGAPKSLTQTTENYGDYADNRAKRRFRRINVRFRVATGGTYRGGTSRLPQPRNPIGPMGSADLANVDLSCPGKVRGPNECNEFYV